MDYGEKADCERIQRVILEKHKVMVTLQQAHELWEEHSDSYAAGWLILPEDDDQIAIVYAGEHHRACDEEFESWLRTRICYGEDSSELTDKDKALMREAFEHGINCGRQGLVT